MNRETRIRALQAVDEILEVARNTGRVETSLLTEAAEDFSVTEANIKLAYREKYGSDILSAKFEIVDQSLNLAKFLARSTMETWGNFTLFTELNGTLLVEEEIRYIYIGAHLSGNRLQLHHFIEVDTRRLLAFDWTGLRINFPKFYERYLHVFEP